MTMTTDELRALADALEPMAAAPRFDGLNVPAFCAWLRAQADAQPVAWMHVDGRVISAATMDQAYRDGGAIQSSLRDYTIPLYTHPAPAAPQAMEDANVWKQIVPDDEPQAEPKREPLSDAIVTVVYELAALIPKPDQPTVDDGPCDNPADRQALQIAYTTARDARDGIGGSDAE